MEYLHKFFFNFYSYVVLSMCYLFYNLESWPTVFSRKIQLYVCVIYFLAFATFLLFRKKNLPDSQVVKLTDYLIPGYYFFAIALLLAHNGLMPYRRYTWNLWCIGVAALHFIHYLYLLYKNK